MNLKSNHKLYIIFWLLTFPVKLFSQMGPKYFDAGQKAMEQQDFHAASFYFQKAINEDPIRTEYHFQYAEACRMFNNYKEAAKAYHKVTQLKEAKNFTLAWYFEAMMLKNQGKYEEALKKLETFKKKYLRKDDWYKKAVHETESCQWALDNSANKSTSKAQKLDDKVNSNFNELNPIPLQGDSILFSSLRSQNNEKNPSYYSRFYSSQNEGSPYNGISVGENSHIGNGKFNADFTSFYYNECKLNENNELKCEIYEAEYKDQKFINIKKLNDVVNLRGYTNTQPAPGIDFKGNPVLYFVSDRPGGKGGLDLWKVNKLPCGSYEKPQNLGGIINTPGDEITPYFDVNSKMLYFSSDYHFGYGGFDVFYAKEGLNVWDNPTNFCSCVNSPANDMYFVKNEDRSKIYFASNRKGSKFITSENCCNDLYMLETPDTKIEIPVEKNSPTDTVSKPEVVQTEQPPAVSKTEVTRVSYVPPSNLSSPPTVDNTTKIKQLIPVTLYFHNDEPECCNLRDTTPLNYVSTYNGYMSLLYEYKSEFCKGVAVGEKKTAEDAIFYLFTNKVEKGYNNLITFSAYLFELLQQGKKVSITIQGYCSPLNYNQYNVKLGYRRVASLRNYFYQYRNGELMPYILSGKLMLVNESIGEEKASRSVSDNREDVRNSVYNPDAAVERKVEIIAVEVE